MRNKTARRPNPSRLWRRFRKTKLAKATMPSLPLEIKSLLREVQAARMEGNYARADAARWRLHELEARP